MSVRRIKAWIMTAACAGLLGLVAGDAHAFGGKVFGKKDACDPCADPCADKGGLKNWFAGLKGRFAKGDACDPCGPGGAGGGAAAPAMPAPKMPAPAAPAAPATQKVKVTEYVPTWVEETVTVMKPVTKTETYTAHKWECVPETVTCQVTVNKMVTETVTENRTVTERVPVQKTVTVMERKPVQKTVTVMERKPVQKTVTVNETQWKNVMVTEMRSKTVVNKVSVPTTVDLGPSLSDRLKKICDPCYTPCPRTVTVCKTERCRETVCEPVTVCKKVAECVPVTKTVCTYECVPVTKTVCVHECVPVQKTVCTYECVTKTVPTQVTKTKCVPTVETVTKTVNVRKCVAYQATRQVTVCEPVQEKRKVCKMVATVVEKDVPVSAGAGAGCGDPCADPCAKVGLLDKIKARLGAMKGKFGHKGDCCAPAPACCK